MKQQWIALPLIALMSFAFATASAASSGSPWGKDYFPNVELTTQDGEQVRFFDDLIADKIVAINFIYTSCPDTCPLETAQLIKVQEIIGDRLGDDVFFYSITIDPDVDTPQVLKEYKERFGAKWTFLTGNEADIIELRRKLGLYIDEIQDGSNNHNVSMIIGNQATGRWMRRSPFENPYVLADQLGNWLDGWKSPPRRESYALAPKLRNVPPGEQLFRTRCATCHSVTGIEKDGALGPDLVGVTARRDPEWLLNWLRAPDQMLRDEDPIAMALFKQYDELAMPNMRLNRQEVEDILDYLEDETTRIETVAAREREKREAVAAKRQPNSDSVAVMNAWVREADARAAVNAGYMTLVNVSPEDLSLVSIESDHYESVEIHEMSSENGLMRMQRLEQLLVPAYGQARLEPGGMHLMLRGPKEPIASGQVVDMTLSFASGERQQIAVKVATQ